MNTLQRIALALAHISLDDMTKAERHIAAILINQGYLKSTINGHCEITTEAEQASSQEQTQEG
jgi:hypothetical protein